MIDIKFHHSKWHYMTSEEMQGELQSILGLSLQQHDSSYAQMTLGIFLALDGNWVKQIEYLTQLLTTFRLQIQRATILPKDAWYSFQSSFMMTIDYCLLATTIKEQEWNDIMRPSFTVSLQKSGVTSTFPLSMRYMPKQKWD